jgi:hypothetical protein
MIAAIVETLVVRMTVETAVIVVAEEMEEMVMAAENNLILWLQHQ